MDPQGRRLPYLLKAVRMKGQGESSQSHSHVKVFGDVLLKMGYFSPKILRRGSSGVARGRPGAMAPQYWYRSVKKWAIGKFNASARAQSLGVA